MKKSLVILMIIAVSGMAMAAVSFDQNVTNSLIFGDGNDNGSFTVDRTSGVELGLRGKLRFDATGQPQNTFNSNGDGTYSFAAGVAPTKSSPVAVWSFEWSINSNYDGNGDNLDAYTYALGIDQNPGAGTSFSVFDPIHDFTVADHAIGNNATTNGSGVKATDAANYLLLLANNNIAQNSWQAHWFIPSIDPTVDGTYDFYLAAFDGAGSQVARTDMQIIVGEGAAVPVPGAFLLGGIGVGCVSWLRRRRSL